MDEELKDKIAAPDTWLRLFLIILFVVVANVLIWLVWVIAGVQFLCSLVTGRVNENLDEFSGHLVIYLTSIFQYLVYRSDQRPFPFTPWEECVAQVAGSMGAASDGDSPPRKRKAAPRKKAATESEAE